MLNTLRKNYVDKALVEMLVAAKKDPTTNTIATNLELLLLTRWLDEKKQPLSIAHWLSSDKSGQMMDHYSRLFKARLSNDNKP
ncbi:hypothetical protein GN958_ATG04110 [Phytophthora infestans]|uniref:RxLR effector protein n=1 Tax=Phytophthora infestans TaxID=4787 RepID=A0A8S9V3P2_PHYIN|nr:hypothetical protein GN958_ATG04110 [Phytophthora infestans]